MSANNKIRIAKKKINFAASYEPDLVQARIYIQKYFQRFKLMPKSQTSTGCSSICKSEIVKSNQISKALFRSYLS